MLKRDNAVVFLGSWLDACSLWRMWMPHLNMPGSSFFCFAGKPDYNRIAGNDIFVVQRCCTQSQFNFIETCLQLGMRGVYEIDDNVWEVPKDNPAYAPLTQLREGFAQCIRMVDAISVSTKNLAKVIHRHVPNLVNSRTGKAIPIIVAENRLDMRLFAPPIRSDRLIIGWAGSSSHNSDLLLLNDAVSTLAVEYPEILFQFRGGFLPAPMTGLTTLPNVTHKHWQPVAEFMARMPVWGWSIALAPVTNHIFNEAKSCIKMIEAAYCRIPCLASHVRPYQEFVDHDSELRWLLCARPETWQKKLRILINEPEMREDLGNRMFAVMEEYYSFNKPHEGWSRIFQEVSK